MRSAGHPLRAFALPRIPSPSLRQAVGRSRVAQDDMVPGFEEPVRVYEVRWRDG